MIAIIDYKTGNVGSILNMIRKIGKEAVITSDPVEIEKADKIILPGVGSFDTGMRNLEELGLIGVLNKKVIEEKTPLLGICLGAQLLFERSEEGVLPGLGWIDGEVRKFRFKDNALKVPHMGWNTIAIKKDDCLFNGAEGELRFYFVHSYHFVCSDNVLAITDYGYEFPSVVRKGNIVGVQFHPEKSHKFGMQLLKNFIESC